MNRRRFISSLAGVAAWAASDIRPTCVACGASWHTTAGCPSNNTAMGNISAIRFDGGTIILAAAFIEYNCPGVNWASYGGQSVFPVYGSSGRPTGSFMAYAMPRSVKGARVYSGTWSMPEHALAVVRL